MNILRRLFEKIKPTLQQFNINDSCNQYDEHEQLLIGKVIDMLKSNPNYFSARWFTGETLNKSVRSKDGRILIMIDTEQICQPIEPRMSREQKELAKKLLKPIVKKDSDYLIKQLISN